MKNVKMAAPMLHKRQVISGITSSFFNLHSSFFIYLPVFLYMKVAQSILLLFIFATSCNQQQMSNQTTIHAIRLKPGEDLKGAIEKLVKEKNIEAGWISTCVGSLTKYNLRFANQQDGSIREGHFEIVSLTGTVSINGSHLHLAVSDSTGATIGGHLLEGNIIYTTAELVISFTDKYEFTRAKDGTTQWEELQIKEK
jgi:predicted DNA-binding protein with PD1-like motif